MQNSQILLHTEETLIDAIHRLTSKSSICRVAVAYCGEAVHQFFPEKPSARPEDLRIMVDASEQAVRCGLTNPKGLERLLGLTDEVRSLAGLHAKVWVFDEDKALVGSTNMSESSITQQVQLTLEVCDSRVGKRLVGWFDTLWNRANQVDHAMVRKLIPLWPKHKVSGSGRTTRAKLPRWRGEVPQPPLGPSDFNVGVSKAKLKKLLSEFKNNKCPYENNGKSCWERTKSEEADNKQLSATLRSLMRRCSSWNKNDLEKVFDLAFTFGRAAEFHRPSFVRQSPAKVAHSLDFLLTAGGDPYVRFEKVLAPGSLYKLNGMGKGGLTFLMYLWNPREFAVIMGPVDKALKALKVSFGRATSSREGQAYKDRTAAVRQIGKLTALKTFTQVDHFLDALAKRHIGR